LPTINAPLSDRVKSLQRFQREAPAAARVWHPHVCPIYDAGEHEGQPYVVMAYVEGQSLAERLTQQGRYENAGEAVKFVRQVLEALQAVHGHGIIHRDLKPGNILIDPCGRAVLTDFGLARPEVSGEHLTSEGVIVGTPAYMAPEQAAGRADHISPWTNLYSLAVVFFQMMTERLPFEGVALTVLVQIVHDRPPLLAGLRPDLDPTLGAVLLRALAKEPRERYQSAGAFSTALEPYGTAPATAMARQGTNPRDSPAGQLPPLPDIGLRGISVWLTNWKAYWLPGAFAVGAALCITFVEKWQAGSLAGWGVLLCFVGILMVFVQVGRHLTATRRNEKGETWLLKAAGKGWVVRVRRHLADRARVNDTDWSGQTALMKAAEGGHSPVVRLLLAWGADPSIQDVGGETAATKAAVKGHTKIVDLLQRARR
jgi:hypothetical protein